MKLAPLLAEFLLVHKRLDLPGIGSFTLAADAQPEEARFETNKSIKDSPELVEFIASHTGKIKALAAADLESQLEQVRQFLNIGKPFLFEGIGSLVNLQSGGFSFMPGTPVTEKANPRAQNEQSDLESVTGNEGFKSIFYSPRARTNHRKSLFIVLLIAGVGLAVWGGYTVYKKTTTKETQDLAENDVIPQETAPVTPQPLAEKTIDTSVVLKDTILQSVPPVTPAPPGNYKFVVETSDKIRGMARYYRLKSFGLDIRIETPDSVAYKLFFLLPAMASDTTRYLDSLKRLYTPAGGIAYIEN